MRPCLHQVNYFGLSTAAFLRLAEQAGFGGVELHPFDTGEPLETVARAVRAGACEVVTVSPLPDWYAAGSARAGDSARRLIEAAAAVGARFVGAPSPVYDPRSEPRPPLAAIAESLAVLAREAAAAGVGVGFEPVGASVKRPGAVGAVGTLADALRLLDAVAPPVGLILDTFCLATAPADLITLALPPPERVAALQLADWDGAALRRCLPGEGVLPLAAFVRRAHAAGYRCPVSLEVFPSDASSRAGAFASESMETISGLLQAA